MNTCSTCNEQIALHADGTLACACETVDYQPSRRDWPPSWETSGHYEETMQARELLLNAAEDTGLRNYIVESVDEADVMRQSGGDTSKALDLCRMSMMAEHEMAEEDAERMREEDEVEEA